MIEVVEISKITFNQISKKYSIHFSGCNSQNKFEIIVSSDIAKKISMSMEGITSDILSPYEMFINMLDFTKLKLQKIVLMKKNEDIHAKISLFKNNNNESHDFYLSATDAIIIGLNTFTDINVESSLLMINPIDIKDYHVKENCANSFTLNDKISSLMEAMESSVKNEKFETAAKLRDKITELKKIKSND